MSRDDLQLIGTVVDGEIIFPVWMEDDLVQTADTPFCSSMRCECHNRRIAENQEAFERTIGDPLMQGLLTVDEAQRLFAGQQA